MGYSTFILLAGAILPVVVLLVWTVRRDRLPEPPKVVLITFVLGALSTIPILIVNLVLIFAFGFPTSPDTLANSLVIAFISAALVEECFKFAVIAGYAARHDAFDEPYDGIVYGSAAALGFAMVENIMYVFGAADFGSQAVTAVTRAVLSIPLHANCGALLGLGIGIGRGRRGGARVLWVILGLAGAIALHGIYNSFAFAANTPEFAERGFEWLAVLGVLVTAASGAAFVALAAARLRRDQLRGFARRAFDAASFGPPPLPRGQAVLRVGAAPAVVPAGGIPVLPIVSLALSSAGAALWIVLLATALVVESMQPTRGVHPTDILALAMGCLLLLGIVLAFVGFTTAVLALVRRSGWIAASIASLIASTSVLLAGAVAITLALVEPSISQG